jgi:hypothetical protein
VAYNASQASSPRDSRGQPARQIHIVTEDWLWQSLRLWRRQDERLYEVKTTSVTENKASGGTEGSVGQRSGRSVALCDSSEPLPDAVDDPFTNDTPPANCTRKGDRELEELMINVECSSDEGSNEAMRVDKTSAIGTLPPLVYTRSPVSPPACTSVSPPASPHNISSSPHNISSSPHISSSPALALPVASSPVPPPQKQKLFLLSGGTTDQHNVARNVLERLGGRVLTSQGSAYDPQCTHLLLWSFKRTEKCMCACAAGKVC